MAYQSHYQKFQVTWSVVEVNDRLVEIMECQCGVMHKYRVLAEDEKPNPKLLQKQLSEVKEEYRKHLLRRVT